MKCDYCGGALNLEMENCPHCGAANEKARQHIQDMKRYQGAFEETREQATTATKAYASATVRMIIIAVLCVLILIAYMIGANAYDVMYRWEQFAANSNSEEKMAIMDTYLEEGDYLGFDAYCEKENLRYAESYDAYIPLFNAASSYRMLYNNIMRIATLDLENEVDYDIEYEIEYLSSSLGYFYDNCDLEMYRYYEGANSQKNLDIVADMDADIKMLLVTYLGVTEEEAEMFKTLSDGRKQVILEEKILNE